MPRICLQPGLRATGESGQTALQLTPPRPGLRELKGTEGGVDSGGCRACLLPPAALATHNHLATTACYSVQS